VALTNVVVNCSSAPAVGQQYLVIGVAGKSQLCSPSPVRWFGAFSSGRALFPVGQLVAFNDCKIFGGILARWFMYSPISVANKAIKLTAFPSLLLWLNATLPQKNQLQSRNLWRRYVSGRVHAHN
jgi:hypothetical protein